MLDLKKKCLLSPRSTHDQMIRAANLLTCGLIVGTNIPLIIFILKQSSKTFLDRLVLIDCFLCMSNALLLFIRLFDSWGSICGCHIFFSFYIQLSNKLLTLGIALYRFILVLGSSLVWTQYQRKSFEKLILLTILLISVQLTGWAVYYREDYRYFLGNPLSGIWYCHKTFARVYLQFFRLLPNWC